MNIIQRIDKIAKEVLEQEYGGYSDNDIRAEMMHVLDKAKDSLILSALGIRWNHWDKIYEPENYGNGLFNKAVVSLHSDNLKKIAIDLYKEIFGNDELKIELNEKDKAHFRKVYKDKYKQILEEEISKLAEDRANIDAEKYFSEYLDQPNE